MRFRLLLRGDSKPATEIDEFEIDSKPCDLFDETHHPRHNLVKWRDIKNLRFDVAVHPGRIPLLKAPLLPRMSATRPYT